VCCHFYFCFFKGLTEISPADIFPSTTAPPQAKIRPKQPFLSTLSSIAVCMHIYQCDRRLSFPLLPRAPFAIPSCHLTGFVISRFLVAQTARGGGGGGGEMGRHSADWICFSATYGLDAHVAQSWGHFWRRRRRFTADRQIVHLVER
jgi:hypothetical protein